MTWQPSMMLKINRRCVRKPQKDWKKERKKETQIPSLYFVYYGFYLTGCHVMFCVCWMIQFFFSLLFLSVSLLNNKYIQSFSVFFSQQKKNPIYFGFFLFVYDLRIWPSCVYVFCFFVFDVTECVCVSVDFFFFFLVLNWWWWWWLQCRIIINI